MSDRRAGPVVAVGERHLGTAAAGVLLLLASRQPVTSEGVASATPSLRVLALSSQLGPSSLRLAGWVLLAVLLSGLCLGATLLIGGTAARRAWWIAAAAPLLGGVALLAALRGNAGPGAFVVLAAGVVACASGLFERRRLLRAVRR